MVKADTEAGMDMAAPMEEEVDMVGVVTPTN
jgi:hypothetical protein